MQLTVIWHGGSPAARTAAHSGQSAAAGQRDGPDVSVQAGRSGEAHHGQTVQGWAVGTVVEDLTDWDVLLCSLHHRDIMFAKRCSGDGAAERDPNYSKW